MDYFCAKFRAQALFGNLHIQVRNDNFGEDAEQQTKVERVVALDLVSVESVETVAVGEDGEKNVEGVADDESVLDRAKRRIAVNFSKLWKDEVSIHDNIDDEAEFVKQIDWEEHSKNFPVM